jgi:flavin-binding protein dodecin
MAGIVTLYTRAASGPECRRRDRMAIARVTEITASSKKSFDDAVEKGVARANKTLKNVQGAWVQDMKVKVDNGKIAEYRVNMKVTFVLEN